jgi:hypothetical protein
VAFGVTAECLTLSMFHSMLAVHSVAQYLHMEKFEYTDRALEVLQINFSCIEG